VPRPSLSQRLYRQAGGGIGAVDVRALPGGEAGYIRGDVWTEIGEIPQGGEDAGKARRLPVYEFKHKERKDDIANSFRRQRQVRDGIVLIGVAQEKAQAFNGKKENGPFEFRRDKTVYVNHYCFYIDDADFGRLFKVCS
jgi:hypothetical protein